MRLAADSRGTVTSVSISSGATPGNRVTTERRGYPMSGRRSTLSWRRDTNPSRTTARKNMAVATGLRMDTRAIFMDSAPASVCRPAS